MHDCRTMRLVVILVSMLMQFEDVCSFAVTADTFKVAVYDQAEKPVAPPTENISRDAALRLLATQLDIYEEVVVNATNQGVKMMVFSEYGLMPSRLQKSRAYNFTETVPDPKVTTDYNPCLRPSPGIEVQTRLSCMALNHSVYVTANIGERDPCDPAADSRCSAADHRYQYNTNVVFDPNGFLVARYRKYNLFMGEPSYDQPDVVDYTYFDTIYGRFGSIVCFDIIFQEPAVSLIERYSIDHVLFPTAWINQLPYYSAVTFHQAFAIGLKVNLIASNLHNIAGGFCGSGIYGSDQTYAFRHDELDRGSQLLVAEIPVRPNRIAGLHPTGRDYDVINAGRPEFSGPLFDDVFNFVWVNGSGGHVNVCHNSLCCLLDYTRSPNYTDNGERFALGAFRGLHTHEGQYYLEICTFVKCRQTNETLCAGDSKTSSTFFTYFNLTGNFTTKYVYPMVVVDGIDPGSSDWHYNGLEIASYGTQKPFISSTIYGRRFDLDDSDEEEVGKKNSGSTVRNAASKVLLCILVALVVLT